MSKQLTIAASAAIMAMAAFAVLASPAPDGKGAWATHGGHEKGAKTEAFAPSIPLSGQISG